jgi:hypothetical protein
MQPSPRMIRHESKAWKLESPMRKHLMGISKIVFVVSGFMAANAVGVGHPGVLTVSSDTCKGKGVSYAASDCPLLTNPPCLLCSGGDSCETGSCNLYRTVVVGGGNQEYCRCGLGTQASACCHAVINEDDTGNRTMGSAGVCRPAIEDCSQGNCVLVIYLINEPGIGWYELADYKCSQGV